MAKDNPNQTVPVSMPQGGLDESGAYHDQRSSTTAVASNVVPWDPISMRRRISRRPGFTKYCSEALATGQPVQDINSVAISRDQTTPSGRLFSVNGASGGDNGRVYSSTGTTVYSTANQQGTQTLGCVDNDGDFYIASINAGGTTFGLAKVDPLSTGATDWTVSMSLTGTGTGPKIWGLAALDDVVYVWIIDNDAPGIYRFATDDGARMDPGAWKDTNAGMVSATATPVRAYQNMAMGGSVLGVVGGLSSNLVLQRIATSGVIATSTTLKAFNSYPCRIVADQGGNFYVLTEVTGTAANAIYKVNTGGNLVSAFGTAGVIQGDASSTGARDIAYEPTTYSLCVVGTAIFDNVTGAGADDSYQRFGAVDGVLVHHGKPNTVATWDAICADGLGNMRLRRSAASGDDLISLNMAGTVVNWAVATALGSTSEMLWLQCTGYNLAPRGSSMQNVRSTRRIGVVGGSLVRFTADEVTSIEAAFVSAGAPVVWSSLHQLKLYYADGNSYRYYDAQTDAAGTLTASGGSSLPLATNGATPTLVMMWRDRLIWAGLEGDMQNYFASAQGDATDYDYNPTPPVPTQAFAGNNVDAGKCPDIITALIPWTDDIAIFGCDHEIWRMTGDPADGGRLDQVSDQTGMAWGRAFCFDPQGTLYFFGSRGGLFRMTSPQGKPQLVSGPIADRLANIDTGLNIIRLVWWDEKEGVIVVVSPRDPTEETTHYFWDRGTEIFSPVTKQSGAFSWWPFVFGNTNLNAVAIHTFDGDEPDDRVILWGGRDGFVRYMDDVALDDDGTAIESRVYMPAIRTKSDLAFLLKDLQAEMGQNSSDVTCSLHIGETLEAAVNNARKFTRTFTDGRNRSISYRARGHAIIPELYSTEVALPWSLDAMRAIIEIKPAGPAQRIFIKSTAPAMDVDIPTPDPEPEPGTPWTPDVYPFRLWVYGGDSSLSALADGDPVETWTNRGGAGGVVWYSGVAGTRPLIKLAGNGLNNLPIIRFDGTDDSLGTNLVASEYWSASAKSIFMVVKSNSDVTNNSKGVLTDAAAFCDIFQRSTGVYGFQNWDGGDDIVTVASTLNNWVLLSAWHGSSIIGLRVNGDTESTGASGATTNVGGQIYLGRRSGLGFVACDIAEVIITNEEVDDDTKQIVEGYLAHKYDLTSLLPVSHPYKTTGPVV